MADLDDETLQTIYTWVDEVPLSRPKRNINRDFSDGGTELTALRLRDCYAACCCCCCAKLSFSIIFSCSHLHTRLARSLRAPILIPISTQRSACG